LFYIPHLVWNVNLPPRSPSFWGLPMLKPLLNPLSCFSYLELLSFAGFGHGTSLPSPQLAYELCSAWKSLFVTIYSEFSSILANQPFLTSSRSYR
jgi:hypothetical protein